MLLKRELKGSPNPFITHKSIFISILPKIFISPSIINTRITSGVFGNKIVHFVHQLSNFIQQMANVVEMSQIDLECGGGGHRRSSAASSDDGSLCFSDADEGSCYSQFYSTADGSYDDEIGEVAEARRVSSAAESDCSVEVGEIKVYMGKVDRDCRICHLSLESGNQESGIAIELGCSCKDDLAAAHSHCAETWFKIKGNKTCEICNSLARNVVGTNETELAQRTNDANGTAANAASAPASQSVETRSCLNGHRFINFLLACMVFAFVISWLFHFNIPS